MNENKAMYEEYDLTDYQIEKELMEFQDGYNELSNESQVSKTHNDKEYYRIAANKLDANRIAFLTAQINKREKKLSTWKKILDNLSMPDENPAVEELGEEEGPLTPDELEQERISCENGGDMSDAAIERQLKELGDDTQ